MSNARKLEPYRINLRAVARNLLGTHVPSHLHSGNGRLRSVLLCRHVMPNLHLWPALSGTRMLEPHGNCPNTDYLLDTWGQR